MRTGLLSVVCMLGLVPSRARAQTPDLAGEIDWAEQQKRPVSPELFDRCNAAILQAEFLEMRPSRAAGKEQLIRRAIVVCYRRLLWWSLEHVKTRSPANLECIGASAYVSKVKKVDPATAQEMDRELKEACTPSPPKASDAAKYFKRKAPSCDAVELRSFCYVVDPSPRAGMTDPLSLAPGVCRKLVGGTFDEKKACPKEGRIGACLNSDSLNYSIFYARGKTPHTRDSAKSACDADNGTFVDAPR